MVVLTGLEIIKVSRTCPVGNMNICTNLPGSLYNSCVLISVKGIGTIKRDTQGFGSGLDRNSETVFGFEWGCIGQTLG